MDIRPPETAGVGQMRSFELRKYRELPYYYRCLGEAAMEAGIVGEFFELVEAGFEFGPARDALCHNFIDAGIEDVDIFLAKFGIPIEHELD